MSQPTIPPPSVRCTACNGNGRGEMLEKCKPCNGTGYSGTSSTAELQAMPIPQPLPDDQDELDFTSYGEVAYTLGVDSTAAILWRRLHAAETQLASIHAALRGLVFRVCPLCEGRMHLGGTRRLRASTPCSCGTGTIDLCDTDAGTLEVVERVKAKLLEGK